MPPFSCLSCNLMAAAHVTGQNCIRKGILQKSFVPGFFSTCRKVSLKICTGIELVFALCKGFDSGFVEVFDLA
jgi:hypothetical protein